MASASSFAFLVLFHLLLLLLFHLTDGQNTCPDSFSCIDFQNNKPISFPFTNSTHPECGLCTVQCDRGRLPTIRLEPEGETYVLKTLAHADTIEIVSPMLEMNLRNRNCNSFDNISLPNSPSISFTLISLNLSFFKCSTDDNLQRERENYFRNDYLTYKNCTDHIIYYKFPSESNNSSLPIGSFPRDCSLIQLPRSINTRPEGPEPDYYPFSLLSANFSLEVHVSPECTKCHLEKYQCGNDGERVKCSKGKANLKLILGAGIPGAVLFLIICFYIFYIWRRKKGYNVKYLPSRTVSSDPSSRPEQLEGGSIYFGVPVFTYTELEEATNNFDPSKELGDGGFGTVYHGQLQDGREVAVKRLYENNCKRVAQFMNEIEILTRLRHQNLVSLYGCTSRHSRELLLVYEYIQNGTVADHLHGDRAKDGPLEWPIRMNIAIETASALTYLHASDIIHRDVKTNNILLDHSFCVKVADFGLSRLFPNDVTHVSTAPQGTPGYVDPDYFQSYQLTDKSDVYSFGVVLIELISSMPAVDISRRHRYEINLANLALDRIQRGAFDELIDPFLGFESDTRVQIMTTSVAELAFRCLQHEKDMRPAMEEVLDVLKGIKGREEYNDEKRRQKNDVIQSFKPPLSPESENVVLLKNRIPVGTSQIM